MARDRGQGVFCNSLSTRQTAMDVLFNVGLGEGGGL